MPIYLLPSVIAGTLVVYDFLKRSCPVLEFSKLDLVVEADDLLLWFLANWGSIFLFDFDDANNPKISVNVTTPTNLPDNPPESVPCGMLGAFPGVDTSWFNAASMVDGDALGECVTDFELELELELEVELTELWWIEPLFSTTHNL